MVAAKSTSLRVGQAAYERARRLGQQSGRSITQVIEDALEQEERRVFWQEFHEAVERLRSDPEAWAIYQAESRELEGTLMDGLDLDEDWSEQFDAPPGAFAFSEGEGETEEREDVSTVVPATR